MQGLLCSCEESCALEFCQLCLAVEDGSVESLGQEINPGKPRGLAASYPFNCEEQHDQLPLIHLACKARSNKFLLVFPARQPFMPDSLLEILSGEALSVHRQSPSVCSTHQVLPLMGARTAFEEMCQRNIEYCFKLPGSLYLAY